MFRKNLLRATCAAALLASASAHAQFNTTPARVIGPTGTERPVGASIGGQDGWTALASDATKLDNEITAAQSHGGAQSWRVSNWYHDGIVTHFATPTFTTTTGESGAAPAPSASTATYSFWFRAPEAGNTGAWISTSLTDPTGARLTYLDLRDDGTSFHARLVGIVDAGVGIVADTPAPFDDAGVNYDIFASGALARGAWYRAEMVANFLDGPNNDTVALTITNAAGASVFTAVAPTWEDAYLAGVFSAPGTKPAVTRATFRVADNPDDFANRGPGNVYSTTNAPLGFWLDDLAVAFPNGTAYRTGFETRNAGPCTGLNSTTANGSAVPGANCPGDNRSLGTTITTETGWNAVAFPALYDQEITREGARSGVRGWRVSNFFHTGLVTPFTSPGFAPAGETGATTSASSAAVSNTVVTEHWFRTASATPDTGSIVSWSLTDAPGRRMTSVALRDTGNPAGVELAVNEVTDGRDASNNVVFVEHLAPLLARGTWYRVRTSARFLDGALNDRITYSVHDAAGDEVWTRTLNSWEDAYLEGQFGAAAGTRSAVDRVNFRVSANPDDTATQAPFDRYSATNEPRGIVIDNFVTIPGVGTPYATSFEGAAPTVTNVTKGTVFGTIAAALADGATAPGDVIELSPGVFNENVTLTEAVTLRGQGIASIVDGTGLSGSGITIASGVTGATIENLAVENFLLGNIGACVYGAGGNSGTTISGNLVRNCVGGRGGIFFAAVGGISNVTIADNEVANIGNGSAPERGIVIWDSFKQNIAITGNWVHDIANCCGIELQDGTASGVTLSDNIVERVGDSGMAAIGLTSGAGANSIANNILRDTGRFGIEIKLPNGTGRETGDGAIVVENNDVRLTRSFVAQKPSEERDIAGIAVYRRGLRAEYGNADIPAGVIVRNNTVSGYAQDNTDSTSDGFGIAVEGLRMRVEGNTVSGNDVGIQRQRGHLPYTANGILDGEQSDLADAYFGRGNSPVVCALVAGNATDGNVTATRDVGGTVTELAATVRNTRTGIGYCGLQSAIDDSQTLAGDTLELLEGSTQAGPFVVGKRVALVGLGSGATRPLLTLTGGATGQAILRVANVANVAIENLRFDVDQTFVGPAITTSGAINGLAVRGSDFLARQSNAGVRTAFGQRNAIAISGAGSVTIEDNTCDGTLATPTQPVYFRACVWLEATGGAITGNVLRGGFYDALVRFSTSPLTLADNEFRGAGVQVTSANVPGPVTIDSNLFDPDETQYAYVDGSGNPLPFGDPRIGTPAVMLKLQNPNGGPAFAALTVSDNVFADHVVGIWAQNAADFTLSGNSFTPRAGSADFTHLVLSNKSGSSDSHTIAPVPLAIAASGNTFNSLGTDVGTHVALWNHAATFAGNPAAYGTLSFTGNVFAGAPARYFDLDDSACAASTTLACLPSLATTLGYAGYPATPVAPFAGNVAGASNTYAGVAPAAMNVVQRVALQDRTFHNDPNVPDRADLGNALGIVDYGTVAAPAVALALAADAGNDGLTRADQQFTTSIANSGGMVQERVKLRTTLTRLSTGPIVLDGSLADSEGDDVRLEFADPGCTIASGNRVDGRCIARLDPVTGGTSVGYVFPQINPGFHLPGAVSLPPGLGWSFYRKPGRFTVALELYGESTGTVYASTSITNFLIRQPVDVTLSNLVQIANGTPRPVSVQTSIAGMSFTVTYDGSTTAPSAPGSYAVFVTITTPEHTGSATGTLVIQPAAAGSITASGGTTFTGTAGLALAGALPSVLVEDVNGDPLVNGTVVFEVTGGGGSVTGATVQTNASGIATLGAWTLGRDAGSNTVAARLPGTPAIAPVAFTAIGAEVADLSLAKSTNTPAPMQGDIANFTLVVSNAGPSNAAVVGVLDALPAGLDVANAQWLCVAGGSGANCGSANIGSGDVAIDDAVVPVGGTLTVLVSATVTAAPEAVVTNVAMVDGLSGTDPVAANDADDASVTVAGEATDALFSDGFEDPAPVTVSADAKTVTLDAQAIAAGSLHAAATLLNVDGDELGRLDAMPHANGIAWRVRHRDADGVERASAWLDAPVLGPYVGAVRIAQAANGVALAAPGTGETIGFEPVR